MTRILLLLAFTAGLAACETVKGAGQDIANAGDAISGAAADVQN
ncbi:MAG: entericidin A/B family lipoprotein [Pseudomonadota bacterium]